MSSTQSNTPAEIGHAAPGTPTAPSYAAAGCAGDFFLQLAHRAAAVAIILLAALVAFYCMPKPPSFMQWIRPLSCGMAATAGIIAMGVILLNRRGSGVRGDGSRLAVASAAIILLNFALPPVIKLFQLG